MHPSRLHVLLSTGAIIATAVSCGPIFTSDSSDKVNTLCGVGGDFRGFDPVDAGDVESAREVSYVYEGLLEYAYLERPYRPIPRLAEAMTDISADGLTYTFKIKPGVHFIDDPCFPGGNGREVVAADFVYSFKRVLDPHLESQGDWIFAGHVLGADDWVKKIGRDHRLGRLLHALAGLSGNGQIQPANPAGQAVPTTALRVDNVLCVRGAARGRRVLR